MDVDGAPEVYTLEQGEWVLIPAAAPDFYISPVGGEMNILEFYIQPQEETDNYIND
jgi:hypothetical protein